MKSHSLNLIPCFLSISSTWIFVFQEYVLNARGINLFTCQWRPLNSEPKAVIFLCHGNLVTNVMFFYFSIQVKLPLVTYVFYSFLLF